jgi:heme exporter protein D
MRNLDFSSWQSLVTTLLGLAAISFVMVAIRLLVMQTVQQRRERENRQINERLRTLIAAYKTLGGSFTGELAVDPTHLRDLQRRQAAPDGAVGTSGEAGIVLPTASERSRRIRDAVEAALSDVILLGTEDQVRLAARAANEMVAGRPIHTAELVVLLRDFIRQVLNLDAVPPEAAIPRQGPARPGGSSGKGKEGPAGDREEGARGGGKGGLGTGGMAAGGGVSMGLGGILATDPERDETR